MPIPIPHLYLTQTTCSISIMAIGRNTSASNKAAILKVWIQTAFWRWRYSMMTQMKTGRRCRSISVHTAVGRSRPLTMTIGRTPTSKMSICRLLSRLRMQALHKLTDRSCTDHSIVLHGLSDSTWPKLEICNTNPYTCTLTPTDIDMSVGVSVWYSASTLSHANTIQSNITIYEQSHIIALCKQCASWNK